jgi:hypothetical protein
MSTLSVLANHTPTPPLELAPDLPPEFSRLVMNMMEKKSWR